MTPLKNEQKVSVTVRLAFIESELKDLEPLTGTTWNIYSKVNDVRRNIERMVENLANACIDISKIILAGESTEMPNSYKEVILKLGTLDVIPGKLAEELAEIVSLRNALAHQYLDLKWDKIKIFLKDGSRVIKEFAVIAQGLSTT